MNISSTHLTHLSIVTIKFGEGIFLSKCSRTEIDEFQLARIGVDDEILVLDVSVHNS